MEGSAAPAGSSRPYDLAPLRLCEAPRLQVYPRLELNWRSSPFLRLRLRAPLLKVPRRLRLFREVHKWFNCDNCATFYKRAVSCGISGCEMG